MDNITSDRLDVSVIICAYASERWNELVDGLFFNHFLYYKDWVQKFQVVQKDYERIVFKIQTLKCRWGPTHEP